MKLPPDPMHPDRRRAGMHAIRQQYENPLAIHPRRRSRESHVSPRRGRKLWPAGLPAQSAIAGMRARRFLHDVRCYELTAREALKDPKDIARGREKAGVSQRPAGMKRIAVVGLPPHQSLAKSGEGDSFHAGGTLGNE